MTSPADAAAAPGDTPAQPSIVLVGPMGAGKTSLGRRIARRLGLSFTDTDKAIVAVHGPIPALFSTHGEPYFRGLERAAVHDALAHGGVIALGGGAVLDIDTRTELAAHRVILLTVDPHVVRGRLGDGTRPLLTGEDPVQRWTRIAAERQPVYEEVADVVFDTSRGPLQDVVDAIVAWIESAPPAQEREQP